MATISPQQRVHPARRGRLIDIRGLKVLAKEGLRAMFATRLKVPAVLTLAVGMLAVGVCLLANPARARRERARVRPLRVPLAASAAVRDYQFTRVPFVR